MKTNKKTILRLKRMKIFALKYGVIRHEQLPEDFIERVKKYKEVLNEVETASLEETLDSFKRDLCPLRELEVWENISDYYARKVSKDTEMSFEKKKELFTKALTYTLG